jgi:hypothetical protein
MGMMSSADWKTVRAAYTRAVLMTSRSRSSLAEMRRRTASGMPSAITMDMMVIIERLSLSHLALGAPGLEGGWEQWQGRAPVRQIGPRSSSPARESGTASVAPHREHEPVRRGRSSSQARHGGQREMRPETAEGGAQRAHHLHRILPTIANVSVTLSRRRLPVGHATVATDRSPAGTSRDVRRRAGRPNPPANSSRFNLSRTARSFAPSTRALTTTLGSPL